jgi:hypothetical protein
MAPSVLAAFVASLLPLGAAEAPAAFDPAFTFPSLSATFKNSPHDSKAPTEAEFSHACFDFIYATVGGGKQRHLKKPVDKIPETVMSACRQHDREGCKRFGEQLHSIVEKKEKESVNLHEKHNHKKGGKRKESVQAEKPKPVEQVVEAPKPAPVAEKKNENDYGMKVWKPKKKHDKTSDSKLALAAHNAQALAKVTAEVMEPIEEAKKMSLIVQKPPAPALAPFVAADYGLDAAEGRRVRSIMRELGENKRAAALIQKPKKEQEKSTLALAAHHAQALAKVTAEGMEPIEEAKKEAKKMSLIAPMRLPAPPSTPFVAADYGLDAAEGRRVRSIMRELGENKRAAALIQTADAPTSYNAWCTNLYAAATGKGSP